MSKTAYHLQLKGFVGGADFDRKAVENILEKNQGKQVNVLIDSTGGNLATGLSITSAFKNYGNVAVVFYYDATALGSNYAVNEQDFRWVVVHEFEKHGWRVEAVYIGCEKFQYRDSFAVSMGGVI